MDIQLASALASSAVTAAVPLLLAGVGELVTEKSGVLNPGVEGMMLMGASTGFVVTVVSGSPWLGLAAAMAAGVAMAIVFAFAAVTMLADQVATGLVLTIVGAGLSAYVGAPFASAASPATIAAWPVPALSRLPVLGEALFERAPVDYFAFAICAAVAWFLYRTRAGFALRTVGESPLIAQSVGFRVIGVRYGATLFGGAMAGLAGGYCSVVQLHLWQAQLTAGRGWLALALVMLAAWRIGRLLIGALIGGTLMNLLADGPVSTPFVPMLPYVATIGVLLLALLRHPEAIRASAPASLGKRFSRNARTSPQRYDEVDGPLPK